jgi:D-alanyl-D-alanine carboxypeptidase
MNDWLHPALTAAERWLDYQHRVGDWPGLQFAVVSGGRKQADASFGIRSLSSAERLTSDSRFRVASHSKTFTAAGIMRLVELERLHLDDKVGRFVQGLHADTTAATIRQLLTHTAGLTRDGSDASQWQMRRPFLGAAELRQALADEPIIAANTRFKYSNHGYGLLGLVLEQVTGEAYASWMAREIVARACLTHTAPDGPVEPNLPLASGHGAKVLLGGERFEVDIGLSTGALAPATGFVSTAGDLAQFYSLLASDAPDTLLGLGSRREMTRRHWRVPDTAVERHYGLGLMHGGDGEWAWFGHSGMFPGCLSHTSVVPAHGLAICIIVNAVDALPNMLVDGVVSILRAYAANGPASAATSGWAGRWWSPWTAFDLLPMRDRVLVASPGLAFPLTDAIELVDVDAATARIGKAPGFANHGETARLEFDDDGQPSALWLGGSRLLPEAAMAKEVRQRFRTSGRKLAGKHASEFST